jgi:hypothetical protein
MANPDRYTMLMASLPRHGPLFGAKQTPLSRVKLEERLQVLEESDAAQLQQILKLLLWGHQPMGVSDVEIVRQANQQVPQVENDLLRGIVESRLELRTFVAALRRRHRGEPGPRASDVWGYGRWVKQIQRSWTDPGFGLQGAFPWLLEANRLLQQDDTVALERLLLGQAWDTLSRASEGHYFDFEAVVIYVLRWTIISRWTLYNSVVAAKRFDELVEAGMDEYVSIFT